LNATLSEIINEFLSLYLDVNNTAESYPQFHSSGFVEACSTLTALHNIARQLHEKILNVYAAP